MPLCAHYRCGSNVMGLPLSFAGSWMLYFMENPGRIYGTSRYSRSHHWYMISWWYQVPLVENPHLKWMIYMGATPLRLTGDVSPELRHFVVSFDRLTRPVKPFQPSKFRHPSTVNPGRWDPSSASSVDLQSRIFPFFFNNYIFYLDIPGSFRNFETDFRVRFSSEIFAILKELGRRPKQVMRSRSKRRCGMNEQSTSW